MGQGLGCEGGCTLHSWPSGCSTVSLLTRLPFAGLRELSFWTEKPTELAWLNTTTTPRHHSASHLYLVILKLLMDVTSIPTQPSVDRVLFIFFATVWRYNARQAGRGHLGPSIWCQTLLRRRCIGSTLKYCKQIKQLFRN